ncbi:hypothetical protein UA08_02287 [Talaromyces atroroseus]|uniref:NAD-dependent epimerase/dehydratase domain-containing protein n=1 Tax=Talaromyces atroroseus TaxID=1441469 RepID=A0A225B638_TALAT|nr:hypothetical protein UA08_02287 [Talaromyces atroroseus]OKL62335.1 hypothetical protein UA08_02287 [Talaromyces atroroseus]
MTANNEIVLVTGINGYIGAHVALSLLQAGYQVRGAVRSAAKGERLRQQPHFKGYADQLTFVEVTDISKPGAYDDAVKGVAVIVHLASPIFMGGDYESVVAPAKNGTLSLLNSILDHSSPTHFRQLVYFSSIAALVRRDVAGNHMFTEKDWNPSTEEGLRDMEPGELGKISYFASKAIAERAVWDFLGNHQTTWTTCILNPAVVYGPIIHPVPSPEELNMTTKPVWDLLTGNVKQVPEALAAGAYVDVRDIASIVTYAVEHPSEVAGGRFPLVAGSGPPQAIADILRDVLPERHHLIPEGQKGKGYKPGTWGFGSDTVSFSSKLIENVTKIDWIPFDRSIKDTVKSFQDVFDV